MSARLTDAQLEAMARGIADLAKAIESGEVTHCPVDADPQIQAAWQLASLLAKRVAKSRAEPTKGLRLVWSRD